MKKFIKSSLLLAALFSTPLISCYKDNNNSSEKEEKKEDKKVDQTPTNEVEYKEGGEIKKVKEPTAIDTNTTKLDSGFYVVKGEVNIKNAIEINGEAEKPVNIILVDGASLSFGTSDSPLSTSAFNGTGALCIYGQKEGTGTINVFTKDVKDVVQVGKYEQKGGNVVINNSATDSSVELGSAIFVNNNLLKVENGLLKLVGNYADGLKASGILVTGGNIDITEANITGDAINSAATIKVERDSQIKISNVTGNGIVSTGDMRLSGKVEVNVSKTAVKSSGVIALQGNNIVAETSSSNLTTYHGVESTNGHIAIDFLVEDKEASLKATDFKVSEGNEVFIVNQKTIINSNDEIIQSGTVSDLTKINNKVLNPAYSVTFDSIVHGSVSIKNNSATYYRPNTELELNVAPDPFCDYISSSLVTNVKGTNVNTTQTGEGNNVTTKYSLTVPAKNVVISAQFKSQFKGNGTEKDPFRIENLDDWKLLFVGDGSMIKSSKYNSLGKGGATTTLDGKYFIRLDADIVITKNSEYDYTCFDLFRGIFDGNGHTITMNVGSPNEYVAGNVSDVETVNNASLFQKAIWGYKIKNLILDGNMYVGYDYAAPLVGITGVTGENAIVTDDIENVWIKTNIYCQNNKYISSLIGRAYSTGSNPSEINLKNIRVSSTINSTLSGDGTFAGLFSSVHCKATSNQQYNYLKISNYVNDVTFNMPSVNNYCSTVGWLEAYSNFSCENTLFIPQNASSGMGSGLYNLRRNDKTNNKIYQLSGCNFYAGQVDGVNNLQINEGDRSYAISSGDGVNDLVVLNDNGSKPGNSNPYSGLTVTTNSLKFNNVNYAKEGATLKLLVNNGTNSSEKYEIVGGSELQKGTTIINNQEVSYYLLTMPASDVVIAKKSN